MAATLEANPIVLQEGQYFDVSLVEGLDKGGECAISKENLPLAESYDHTVGVQQELVAVIHDLGQSYGVVNCTMPGQEGIYALSDLRGHDNVPNTTGVSVIGLEDKNVGMRGFKVTKDHRGVTIHQHGSISSTEVFIESKPHNLPRSRLALSSLRRFLSREQQGKPEPRWTLDPNELRTRFDTQAREKRIKENEDEIMVATEIGWRAGITYEQVKTHHVSIIGRSLMPIAESKSSQNNQEILIDQGKSKPAIKTEQEVLADYHDFLTQVQNTAANDPTPEGIQTFETAKRFLRESVYLSSTDWMEGVAGLTARNAQFLQEDPDNQLFFYIPRAYKDKSQGRLATAAQRLLSERVVGAPERVQLLNQGDPAITNLQQLNPKKTRIVLFDDWAVTGNHISNMTASLLKQLEIHGSTDFVDSVEINLLLVRKDQANKETVLSDNIFEDTKNIPVFAYYESPALESVHAGPTPSGADSSVDYGFEKPIEQMHEYLSKYRTPGHIPYVARVRGQLHPRDRSTEETYRRGYYTTF